MVFTVTSCRVEYSTTYVLFGSLGLAETCMNAFARLLCTGIYICMIAFCLLLYWSWGWKGSIVNAPLGVLDGSVGGRTVEVGFMYRYVAIMQKCTLKHEPPKSTNPANQNTKVLFTRCYSLWFVIHGPLWVQYVCRSFGFTNRRKWSLTRRLVWGT